MRRSESRAKRCVEGSLRGERQKAVSLAFRRDTAMALLSATASILRPFARRNAVNLISPKYSETYLWQAIFKCVCLAKSRRGIFAKLGFSYLYKCVEKQRKYADFCTNFIVYTLLLCILYIYIQMYCKNTWILISKYINFIIYGIIYIIYLYVVILTLISIF